MKSRTRRPPARGARFRLPAWVTVLGLVLVLGELTGGAIVVAGRGGGLAALGGARRMVALQVDGACGSDSATYRTPTGRGQFEITAGRDSAGLADCISHGGTTAPTLQKTVAVPAGGTVTITTFNAYDFPELQMTCSIVANGTVLTQVVNGKSAHTATCRAKIP